MSEAAELAVVEEITADKAPAIYVKGGLTKFLDAVKAEVGAEVPDLSTKKGRDRIASLAAKVSRSKVAVETPGREYLKRLKEMPKVIEAELREFVTAMDKLRDDTRRPLTQWEEAEAARVAGHKETLDWLAGFIDQRADLTSEQLQSQLSEVEAFEISKALDEFEADAARGKDKAITALRDQLTKRLAHEEQLAEIARFNAEKAEREQREREERIAREAAEAERLAAERRAQEERDATARREAEAKAAAEKRELELKLQAEQAEREKVEAHRRAEQAERDAQARAEQAANAERQRIADEKRLEEEEAARREADTKYRAAINRAALQAFVTGGMTEECAKLAVTLIAQGRIPAVAIRY